jgi:predicted ATP-dependent serine protease
MTEKMNILDIPAATNELKGRRREMFELIQNISSGERLIQLLGVPGIGKSSLVLSVMQNLSERRVFLGGIVLI